MPHKHRLIKSLGWAIALATPFESAMAQERPNQQNERRDETPQRQDEGKPKDDDGKAKRKDEKSPKARENRPAPELKKQQEEKKQQDEKPAPKSQSAPPPKSQVAPAKEAPDRPPSSEAPDRREPGRRGRAAPESNTPPAPVAEPPAAAPRKDQPASAPPKAAAPPPAAPPVHDDTKPAPAKPQAAPSKPESEPSRETRPPATGNRSAAPETPPPATAPAATTAPPAAPAQQAAPQKPAALPAAPADAAAPKAFQPGFQPTGAPPQKLQDIQKGRTERVEDGGKRTVIQETDNRVIIKQDNRTIIRHDETQRFAKNATDVKSERRSDGTTVTIIVQPGGIQVYNIVDDGGRTIRRYRRDERGREIDLIDNRSFYRGGAALGVGLVAGAVALALRPPEIRIPREKYIVDYDRASDEDIYETLTAPPVEKLERRYSLEEVRFNHELRERMRRLDLDTVTFEFGSWEVASSQFPKLERVAKVMDRVLQGKPDEVFLVEGHTDAVGADVDNLTLSDRRAQAVAEILTGVFRVPAENLVTQGYGEQYLKVQTQNAEQANRRVAIRRITPLMAAN